MATVSALAPIAVAPFPGVIYTPFVGQPVTGTGIPDGTTVLSIQSPTALTLSANATAGAAGTVLTFGSEPVTLADVKIWCRVQFTQNDAMLRDLMENARLHCETRLKQALITQTYIAYYDGFPAGGGYYNRDIRQLWVNGAINSIGGASTGIGFYPGMMPNSTGIIEIPWTPLQSVVSVQYTDLAGATQTVPTSVYSVSKGIPGRIQPHYNQVWPIARPELDSVQVTFTSGFGPTPDSIPANVKNAMSYLIYSWYANPQPVLSGRYTLVPDVVNQMLSPTDPGIYG